MIKIATVLGMTCMSYKLFIPYHTSVHVIACTVNYTKPSMHSSFARNYMQCFTSFVKSPCP